MREKGAKKMQRVGKSRPFSSLAQRGLTAVNPLPDVWPCRVARIFETCEAGKTLRKGDFSRTLLYFQHPLCLAAENLGLQPILGQESGRLLGPRRALPL